MMEGMDNLCRHELPHVTQKQYNCDIYEKFRHSSYILTITGEKLSQCQKCHKMVPTLINDKDIKFHETSGPVDDSIIIEKSDFSVNCVREKDGRFKCFNCKLDFSDFQDFCSHRATHCAEEQIVCTMCGKNFQTFFLLNQHETLCHTQDKSNTCEFCGMTLPNLDCLCRQTLIHTGEKPNESATFENTFLPTNEFELMGLEHNGVKSNPKLYVCDICRKSFTRSGHLSVHKLIHTGERAFQCEMCQKGFISQSHLSRHKVVHSKERVKPFKCETCGKCFGLKANLTGHKGIHTGEKRYICDVCGDRFTHAGSLSTHKLTHTGEKPHKCDTCGRCFALNAGLTSHKRTHKGEKPFKCKMCDKNFSTSSTLARHRLSGLHSINAQPAEIKTKTFVCETCQKSFLNVSNLIEHILTHKGGKPYKCDVCGKCFAQPGNLFAHASTHTKE